MKAFQKTISLLAAVILVIALAACGGSSENNHTKNDKETPSTAKTETQAEQMTETSVNTAADSDRVLVAYFSATGTTKGVAQRIADITGGDLYEIIPAQPYTDDDLNYNDDNSRTTMEQNDKTMRPELSGETLDLNGYSTVYVGYPIWWGQEPRIMDTFVESCDFSGKTVIPFCTSGSSGIGSSDDTLASLANSGDWKEGKRFSGSSTDEELQELIDKK